VSTLPTAAQKIELSHAPVCPILPLLLVVSTDHLPNTFTSVAYCSDMAAVIVTQSMIDQAAFT